MKKVFSAATVVASVSLAQIAPAWSHTISIGYENVGANALNFWYGTYHAASDINALPGNHTEGSFRLVQQNGSFSAVTAFTNLVSSKPSGLVDGDTNFYAAAGSTAKSSTNVDGRTVLYWQGVSFANLSPGTYTFTYVPITNPSQTWQPIANAILSNTVTLTRADLAGPSNPRMTAGNTYTQASPEAQVATAPTAIFAGGTLQPTADTTFSQPVSLTVAGGTIDTSAGNATLTGPIDGRGVLTKAGTGTLSIQGTNTNSGGLAINGGAVNVAVDAGLGSAGAPVTLNGGALQFGARFTVDATRPVALGANGGTFDTQGYDGTLAGVVSGPGSLTKAGTGSLTLTGANTYAGGTVVAAGTLIGDTTSLRGAITDNSAVVLNQATDGTYSGAIAGSGSLTKTGVGTLTLGGANTYTGGTTIRGSAIALGNLGALGTGDIVLDNGTLLSTVTGTVGNNIRSVGGTSNTIAAAPNQTLGLTGAFDGGTGTITTFGSATNTGVVTFAPATYSGDPSNGLVVTGGTLQAGNDQLGRATAISQSTTIAPAALLDLGSRDTTIRNLGGSGTIDTGTAATLTLGGGTFAGTITGAAGLTLLGNGIGSNATVLSGVNTYQGDTNIGSSATLTVQGGSAIPAASGVTNNGTFLVAGSQTIGSLAGSGGTGIANAGTLTIGGNNRDTAYAGAITGDGGLAKVGLGTMILSGASTYAGPTTVSGGTLQVDGAIASGASVQSGATLGGSGAIGGAVVIADGGTLSPGGTSVGTLSVGSLALSSGSILNYDLGQAGAVGSGINDLVQVAGNLTLAGRLNVNAVGALGEGVYRLFNYGGALTDNGLTFGTLPSTVTPDALSVQTANAGQVNLVLAGSGNVQFWDGTHAAADNVISGGNGTWSNASTNWTSANGSLNNAWNGGFAVFQGAHGTITVDGAIRTTGMQFTTDGYRIVGTPGSVLTNDTAQTSVRVDPGVTAQIAATLAGSAAVVKRDTGTLILSGTNTYAGGTTVAGGVLSVSRDENLGEASGGLTLDGGTLQATASFASNRATTLGTGNGSIAVDAGQTLTLIGAIGGSGSLTKLSDGTLTLAGTSTFTGPTTVTGGTLSLAAGASLTSAVTNGATFDNAGTATGGLANAGAFVNTGTLAGGLTNTGSVAANAGRIDGPIANRGSFTVNGTVSSDGSFGNAAGANLAVGGAYAVAGLLTNAGTIGVAGGGTLGDATLIDNGGTIAVAQGGTVTAALANSGAIVNAGTVGGDVRNAASGAVTNQTMGQWVGRLLGNLGAVLNLGSWIGDGANDAGGSATNSGTWTTSQGPFVNASTLDNIAGARLAGGLVTSGTVTNAGTIVGPVAVTGGSLTTSGTVSGDLANAAVTTASGALNGSVANARGATFAVAGSLTGIGAFTNDGALDLGGNALSLGSLAGSDGTAVVRNGSLTVGGDNTSTTYAGSIADGGTATSLTKTGAGTLTLTGSSAYSGGTVLNGGRLVIGSDRSLGTSLGSLALDGGALETTADLASARSITLGAGGGTLSPETGTVLSLSGSVGGAGRLTKDGAGTLTLAGPNTYTGGTLINAGILTGSAAAFGTGAITNNATLVIDQPTTATLGNAIDGTGVLVKTGTGTLTLTGGNAYTGGTVLAGGRLSVASNTNLGALTGGLALAGGALQTTADLTSARTIGLAAGGGTLAPDAGTVLTLSGSVSGVGGLTKEGAGTLTLAGTNTYTGGTLVNAGVLTGSAAGFGTGAITNNATLVVDQATTASLGNAFNGGGTFVKTGAGSLTYIGTGTLSGPTLVAAGQLTVDGSLANSTVTVASGATLGGTGTVGGIAIQGGGALAPAHGSGALTVGGNVAFAPGSVYRVQADAAGHSDEIRATGTATLAGGTVEVLATPGAYQPRTRYAILTAAGGISGGFAGVTSNLAFLTPFLGYDADTAYLTLARNDLSFATVAQTRNQGGVADAAQASGVGTRLYDAVAVLSASQAQAAFNALSGEVHASAVTTQFQTAFFVREAILDHLRWDGEAAGCGSSIGSNGISALDRSCSADLRVPATYTADAPGRAPTLNSVPAQVVDTRVFQLWGQGFGAFGSTASNGNAARLDRQVGGFVLGGDVRLQGDWRIGVAGGYSFTTFDVTGRSSSGTVESAYGAVYGSGNVGAVQIRGGAVAGGDSLTTRRAVAFAGFGDTNSARYGGTTAQAVGEVGYRLRGGVVDLEPFVGGAVIRIGHDRFSEGGGASALTSPGRDYDLATSTIGVRGEVRLGSFLDTDLPISARGLLGYRRAYGDVVRTALLAFGAGGQTFLTAGVPIDRDALVAEAGLDWRVGPATTLGISYTGQVGSRAEDHGVKGNFTYRF